MKTSFSMAVLMVFVLIRFDSYSQTIPTYPIPSYNVHVNGYANFRDNYVIKSNPSKAKQELDVQARTTSGSQNCQATVWVYSLDQTTVLGPYTITCGQTLTIPIDEREWGVLVESDEDVIIDVWKTTSSQKKSQTGALLQDQKCELFEKELFNYIAEI